MTGMWNPLLETMPREQLRSLQVRKFREQVEYAYENSEFYGRKFDEAGLDPASITSLEDVRRVPPTTKDELREAQGEDPFPYGELLAVDPEAVTEYHQTSGTTGDPVRQADTGFDWEWWSECWATVLWAQGIRPDDRMFFPFSYNVFVAFWAAHYAAEKIGAEVVPGGNLSSAQRVRKMDELDVTAFASTPTYALRLAEVAEDEGFEPAEMAVERVVCAGEPGASIPGTKRRIEERWGVTVYDHAGATETGAWGFSCDGDSVGLHVNEAMFLVEVLDDDGEPVDPGQRGELVVTPLDRRGQPYIRFKLRDEVELASHEACSCDRTFRFAKGGVLGRADDLTKINGVLFSPTAVEDAVRRYDHVSDEYRIDIDHHPNKNVDTVELVAEVVPGTDRDPTTIRNELRKQLKQQTKLTFEVSLEEFEALDRPELKADRVTDHRSSHS